jgi:broad specificity phosphatase PhoE
MKRLYLIRHGQTEWNVAKRMQGRLDSPLTSAGRNQAAVHGRLLSEIASLEQLVVSPSGRTRETACILNSHVRAPMRHDEALMERDCGEWSGLTIEEIERHFPEAWEARQEDPFYHRPPGGENHEDLVRRARPLLTELLSGNSAEVGLVTHGVMSRAIVTHLLDLTPVEAVGIRHPNDLVYRLDVSPGGVQASHFLAGDGPRAGLLRQNENETISGPARAGERRDR